MAMRPRFRMDLVFACVVAALWLLTAAPWAKADDLTAEQVQSIYAVAYGQYPGPRDWLDKRPSVHVVERSYICELAHAAPDCYVLGLYIPDHVYLENRLDFSTFWATSILLHEFIHHLQYLKHGYAALDSALERGDVDAFCRMHLEKEHEAYMIQAHVLEKVGDYSSARIVRNAGNSLSCPVSKGGE